MKVKPLSPKDLVKLGVHELKQGYTLNQIEADFKKKGVERKEAIRALKVIDYYKKREELKAREEEVSKKEQAKATAQKQPEGHAQTTEKKSSFWIYFFVFLVLIGLALFYYFYK